MCILAPKIGNEERFVRLGQISFVQEYDHHSAPCAGAHRSAGHRDRLALQWGWHADSFKVVFEVWDGAIAGRIGLIGLARDRLGEFFGEYLGGIIAVMF